MANSTVAAAARVASAASLRGTEVVRCDRAAKAAVSCASDEEYSEEVMEDSNLRESYDPSYLDEGDWVQDDPDLFINDPATDDELSWDY